MYHHYEQSWGDLPPDADLAAGVAAVVAAAKAATAATATTPGAKL